MSPIEAERKTQIMQRMKKADRERFVAAANAIIASLGAVVSDRASESYHWILATKLGGLRLTVTENSTQGPGAVFCRFDQPEVASRFVGCNEYSGKWNHYWFEGTVDYALQDLEHRLKSVMPVANVA
jgi:hypothetical protein